MQILLTIAYDGTNYAGWQRQDNAITVQEEVENALASLLGCPVVVRAASRTDAGVHALGQRVTFFADVPVTEKDHGIAGIDILDKWTVTLSAENDYDIAGADIPSKLKDSNISGEKLPILKVPLHKLAVVLTGMLPSDISVTAAETVPDDFNPRFGAKAKTYAYKIHSAPCPNPLLLRYAAHVPQALNLEKMQKAAQSFIGRHDFAAFCATGSSAKTTVREVYSCDVDYQDNMYTLTIRGNAFLYNMVRIIAGTVLYAGMGKINDIPEIIASLDRTKAGKTMPPQGLTLLRVEY